MYYDQIISISDVNIKNSKFLQYIYQMKCVSIVYRRPNSQGLVTQFAPIKSTKRSVDDYIEKLKEKQQTNRFTTKVQPHFVRSTINTAQPYRTAKSSRLSQNVDGLNIVRMRASCENILKHEQNPEQNQDKKQKKFRSTFVKRKQSGSIYSLKGITMKNNQNLFSSQIQRIFLKRPTQQNKNQAKVINLKKLKLVKNTTVMISIDFILNQNNFWQEQNIDQTVHKNWKILQEHSNIIWLTKRENSMKKLQRYANEFGLRLDGVYQIIPKKKSHALNLSLLQLQRDFKFQFQTHKKQDFKREIIFINSLKVQSIKNLGYQQFYNSFPTSKYLRFIVHFIQVDMNDKQRFNSPLKILSKDKLPHTNSVNHLFSQFHKNENIKTVSTLQMYSSDLNTLYNDDQFSKQQMMQRYDEIKQDIVGYFSHNLKVPMNKKVKIDESQFSLQFVIGDMLRRNFNIIYNYKKDCPIISKKLNTLKKLQLKDQKTEKTQSHLLDHHLLKAKPAINIESLVKYKLKQRNDHLQLKQSPKRGNQENTFYYKQPVFMWKK